MTLVPPAGFQNVLRLESIPKTRKTVVLTLARHMACTSCTAFGLQRGSSGIQLVFADCVGDGSCSSHGGPGGHSFHIALFCRSWIISGESA